jgi:hypothetical protein
MGSANGMLWRWGVALSLVLLGTLSHARADVTTERGSSILIFPKVSFDSSSALDTVIQISNIGNSLVFAHCFYVNAAPRDPTQPPSASNPPQWEEVDFEIVLTKQQPTHWLVSTGRRFDPSDNNSCKVDCSNAGFDPAVDSLIPPVSDPFTGELKCIEVDSSGAPVNGNHLKGEATMVTADGDASKYDAIGVVGLDSNDGNNTLCLGGGITESCPYGAEYNACPQTLILNHFAIGATDPVVEELGNGPSDVTTELTLVPCSQDFENQIPGEVTVQFLIVNEFEEVLSTSTTVTCWANADLADINRVFRVGLLGSRFAQTRMTPASDDQPGLVGVVEEIHRQGARRARAALNLHVEGQRPRSDLVIVPGAF